MLNFIQFKEEIVKCLCDEVGKRGMANIDICTEFQRTPEGLSDRLNVKRVGSAFTASSKLEFLYAHYCNLFSHEGGLEEIYEKVGSEFYIIPSSTEELIIMPSEMIPDDGTGLNHMLRAVNTEIERQTVLANNVMFYNEDGELSVVEG